MRGETFPPHPLGPSGIGQFRLFLVDLHGGDTRPDDEPAPAAVLHGVATPQMPQPMNIAMNRGQAELTP